MAGWTGDGGGLADGERGGREPPRGWGRTHPDRKCQQRGRGLDREFARLGLEEGVNTAAGEGWCGREKEEK